MSHHLSATNEIPFDTTKMIRTVEWLKCVIALSFAVTLLPTCKLWLTTRDYPLTPIWSSLPQPPFPVDFCLFALMFAALIGAAVVRSPRPYLWLVFSVAVFWAITDQSRWQPYVVHFMALLTCFFLLPANYRHNDRADYVVWALMPARLLLIFTYLYSGIQKINEEFATWLLPHFLAPLQNWFGIDVASYSVQVMWMLGIGAAVIEAGAGFMLLLPKTRRIAVLLLMAMHTLILLIVSPIGLGWNQAVWPWNITMIFVI